MNMKVTILGSGTSTGVPLIGCHCKICTSNDPHDKRLRCSSLLEIDGVRILIDCGPDFREQIINLPFLPIDAVLITHEHYDHVGGLDDLRPFSHILPIPIYVDDKTFKALHQRMPYCFAEHLYPGVPEFSLIKVNPYIPFSVKGIEIIPFTVMHGNLPILGFRINHLVYITDMLTMPDESYQLLEDVDVLIMNALRIGPHPSHQTLSAAISASKRIHARETYFVHMSHQIGFHQEVEKILPPNMHLAYDGQEIIL